MAPLAHLVPVALLALTVSACELEEEPQLGTTRMQVQGRLAWRRDGAPVRVPGSQLQMQRYAGTFHDGDGATRAEFVVNTLSGTVSLDPGGPLVDVSRTPLAYNCHSYSILAPVLERYGMGSYHRMAFLEHKPSIQSLLDGFYTRVETLTAGKLRDRAWPATDAGVVVLLFRGSPPDAGGAPDMNHVVHVFTVVSGKRVTDKPGINPVQTGAGRTVSTVLRDYLPLLGGRTGRDPWFAVVYRIQQP